MRLVNGLAAFPVLCLAAMGFQSPAVAATFNVFDVAGLRAALLTAATNGADDVILLGAGTYATGGTAFTFVTNESNSLTLQGANGTTRSQVVLDGGSTSQVLNFSCVGSCGALTLQGLTVQNGNTTGAGGGVNTASPSLTLADVSVSGNNAATWGGAISGGAWTVTNSIFSNNTAGTGGGAISGTGTVTNSTFSHNTVTNGSGSAISGGADSNGVPPVGAVTVTNSTFSNNTVTNGSGGAISNGAVTVTNSSFSGNTNMGGQCDPTPYGVFSGGGAISGYTVTVTNSSFSNNTTSQSGGAIYGFGSGTVINSMFSNNKADCWGGAISGSGNVTNSSFSNNTASLDGGAIYGSGTVTNSTFSNNATASGVTQCSSRGCTPTLVIGNGGAISSGGGTIVNNTFSGNSTMGSGAAIYLPAPTSNSTAIINSVFYGHSTPAIYAVALYNLYNNLVHTGTGIAGSFPLMAGNVAPGATSPFVDAAHGNFQLVAGSPAINAGLDPSSTTFADLVGSSNVAALRQALLTDLLDNPRPTPGTAVDIGAYESTYTATNSNAPTCTLTATPASIAAGGTSTLTASCGPAATYYAWTGGTCAGTIAASCTVTPSATITYTVAGINSGGTGATASATVTVTPAGTLAINGISQNYGSATISFTTPPQFTSYTVICTAAGQTTRTATGTSSPITVQGLTGGVPYSCAVTASDGTITSAPSVAVPVTARSIVPMMMQLLFD